MSDTKRILLLIGLVFWCIFALAVSTRAEEFTSPKCGEEVALNIPVHKKLGTSHRVTGDYGGFGGSVPAAGGSGWFGMTDTPGATDDSPAEYVACVVMGTPTGTGTCTVSKIAFYHSCSQASYDIQFGFYTVSTGTPNSLVATEETFQDIGVLDLGWHEYTLVSPVALTCGTSYYICYNAEASGIATKIAAGGNQYCADSKTFGDAWGSTFVLDAGPVDFTGSIKAYYTY